MRSYPAIIAFLTVVGLTAVGKVLSPERTDTIFIFERTPGGVDSLGRTFIVIEGDTLHTSFIPDPFEHKGPLTEADYKEIAAELDC